MENIVNVDRFLAKLLLYGKHSADEHVTFRQIKNALQACGVILNEEKEPACLDWDELKPGQWMVCTKPYMGFDAGHICQVGPNGFIRTSCGYDLTVGNDVIFEHFRHATDDELQEMTLEPVCAADIAPEDDGPMPETKFHEGDYVVCIEDFAILKVSKVLDHSYALIDIEGYSYYMPHYAVDNDYRLFSDADCKAGDILKLRHEDCMILVNNKTAGSNIMGAGVVQSGEFKPKSEIYIFDKLIPATADEAKAFKVEMQKAGYWYDTKHEKLVDISFIEPNALVWTEGNIVKVKKLDDHFPGHVIGEYCYNRAEGCFDGTECMFSVLSCQPANEQEKMIWENAMVKYGYIQTTEVVNAADTWEDGIFLGDIVTLREYPTKKYIIVTIYSVTGVAIKEYDDGKPHQAHYITIGDLMRRYIKLGHIEMDAADVQEAKKENIERPIQIGNRYRRKARPEEVYVITDYNNKNDIYCCYKEGDEKKPTLLLKPHYIRNSYELIEAETSDDETDKADVNGSSDVMHPTVDPQVLISDFKESLKSQGIDLDSVYSDKLITTYAKGMSDVLNILNGNKK